MDLDDLKNIFADLGTGILIIIIVIVIIVICLFFINLVSAIAGVSGSLFFNLIKLVIFIAIIYLIGKFARRLLKR